MIKNRQKSAIQQGATETTQAIPTKEGRRRYGAGQGNNKEKETTRELVIIALTPLI